MAQPFDAATTLQLVSNIIREDYYQPFLSMYERFGQKANLLFPEASEPVYEDGKTFQVEVAPGDNIRFNLGALDDFPSPSAFQAQKVKVRFNEQNQNAHDFTRMAGSGRVSQLELDGVSTVGAATTIADRIYRQINEGYDEMLAVGRHYGRTNVWATYTGSSTTFAQNDNVTFASCTASTTGLTSCRIVISAGSVSAFQRGRQFDVYSGSTRLMNGLEVTDNNPTDYSVGFKMTANSTDAANLNGINANAALALKIVPYGGFNAGIYSFDSWMTAPAATGDSFMGGIDRMSATYRHFQTIDTRRGATSAKIRRTHLDDLALAVGFRHEDVVPGVVWGDPRLHQTLRQDIGEDAFIPYPSNMAQDQRWGHYGSMGVCYQHPSLGVVVLMADALARPNTLRYMVSGDWLALRYGSDRWKFMPGDGSGGMFRRMPSGTPGNGYSMIYQCDGYAFHADWCNKPWRQGQILNVNP